MSDDRGVDLRRSTCKKWRLIDGRRTPCGLPRDHEGLCTWAFIPPVEDEMANRGPYEDSDAAMQQFANWSHNLPVGLNQASVMMVNEALLRAGVIPTAFEHEYLTEFGIDPILATILSGWLIHARR
jgi:hypothetical protein